MYKVLYNMALIMWTLLFAGCAYCAALMYLLTSGVTATLWGVACLIWLGLLVAYLVDCVVSHKRKMHKKRKAAKRAGTR